MYYLYNTTAWNSNFVLFIEIDRRMRIKTEWFESDLKKNARISDGYRRLYRKKLYEICIRRSVLHSVLFSCVFLFVFHLILFSISFAKQAHSLNSLGEWVAVAVTIAVVFVSKKIRENETHVKEWDMLLLVSGWLSVFSYLLSFLFACILWLFPSNICFSFLNVSEEKKRLFRVELTVLSLLLIPFTFNDEKQHCKLHYHASLSKFDLRLDFALLLLLFLLRFGEASAATVAASASAKKILCDY